MTRRSISALAARSSATYRTASRFSILSLSLRLRRRVSPFIRDRRESRRAVVYVWRSIGGLLSIDVPTRYSRDDPYREQNPEPESNAAFIPVFHVKILPQKPSPIFVGLACVGVQMPLSGWRVAWRWLAHVASGSTGTQHTFPA